MQDHQVIWEASSFERSSAMSLLRWHRLGKHLCGVAADASVFLHCLLLLFLRLLSPHILPATYSSHLLSLSASFNESSPPPGLQIPQFYWAISISFSYFPCAVSNSYFPLHLCPSFFSSLTHQGALLAHGPAVYSLYLHIASSDYFSWGYPVYAFHHPELSS